MNDLASLDAKTDSDIIQMLSDRLEQKIFYTLAGPVLLSLVHDINREEEFRRYREQNSSEACSPLDPGHLYFYLMKIYHQLCQQHSSQNVIIGGLSNTGKSPVFLNAMEFLSAADSDIMDELNSCYNLISSINSVQTATSASSSRSTMHLKIFYDNKGRYSSAEFLLYGLRLKCVTRPRKLNSENNFKLFYILLYGETPLHLGPYKLSPMKEYTYLPFTKDCGMNYNKELQQFKDDFLLLGTEEELNWIFKIAAIILHIGNISFVAKKNVLSFRSRTELDAIQHLLGCNSLKEFEESLLKETSEEAAEFICDELSLILYGILTTWLLKKINQKASNMMDVAGLCYIGLLDVCATSDGAEKGLDAFIANSTNEKIRDFFYQQLLEMSPVEFVENEACVLCIKDIGTFLKDSNGLSIGLEEFVEGVAEICEKNEAGRVEGNTLLLDHYFGQVSYDMKFWEPSTYQGNVKLCTKLLKMIPLPAIFKGNARDVPDKMSGVSHFGELDKLTSALQSSQPHFIRCIRFSQPGQADVDKNLVFSQLHVDGTIAVAEISQYIQIEKDQQMENYCNFPGGKRKKRKMIKKRNRYKSSTNLLLREDSSLGSLQGDGSSSPRKRSKSIRHIIRPKSKAFKAEEAKIIGQDIRAYKPFSTPQSLSYTSKTLQEDTGNFQLKRSSSAAHRFGDNEDDSESESDEGEFFLSGDELDTISDAELSEGSPNHLDDFFIPQPLHNMKKTLSSIVKHNTNCGNEENSLRETFYWRENKISPSTLITNVDILHALTQQKLEKLGVLMPGRNNAKERELKAKVFLEFYQCGSILRTFYQVEKRDEFQRSSSETGVAKPQSKLPKSSSVSESARVPPKTRIQQIFSPRFSGTSDEESDDEFHVGIEEEEKVLDINWEIPNVPKRHSTLLLNLTPVDAINQINYANPICLSPILPNRRKKEYNFQVTQDFSFSAFAEKRFRIPKKMEKLRVGSSKYKKKFQKLISATKSPIRQSLLELKLSHADLAVDCFSMILKYMINSEPASGEDIRCASGLLYSGLRFSPLRDEIYCQLIKQATNNFKEKFVLRIWQLIAFCTGCFTPSSKLQEYILKFFDTETAEPGEIGDWASYAKGRLLKMSELSKRSFVPTEKELAAVKQRKPLIQVFYFLDGRQKQIPVHSATTCTEALEFLLQMVGLKDSDGYQIFEHTTTTHIITKKKTVIERSLLYSEVLCNSLGRFEEFKRNCPEYIVESTFRVQRKLFLSPRTMPTGSIEILLLYHQTKNDILQGHLLVKEYDALVLCALQRQEKFGDFLPSKYKAKSILPENIRHQKPEREWFADLNTLHQSLLGMTKEEARKRYVQYSIQLPFFGYSLFAVIHSSPHWKMPSLLYLGIHKNGIFFFSAEKEVYYSFSYFDLVTYCANPYSVQLCFMGTPSIDLRTNQADEIVSLLIDYKCVVLKEELQ